MLRKTGAVLGLTLLLAPAGATGAGSARTWTVSSEEELARGEFEGTAMDEQGRVRIAPVLESLWGPDDGTVWDLAPDDAGGGFVALSSPGRVVHVGATGDAETWHEAGEESLVAAIAADGEGGVYLGVSPEGRLLHARAPNRVSQVAETGALFIWALATAPDGAVWIGTGMPGLLLRHEPGGDSKLMFESADDPVRCIATLPGGEVLFGTGGQGRVIRLGADGRPFVLFDADEAEVVALEPASDGSLWILAASGSKQIGAAKSTAEAAAAAATESVRVVAEAPPSPEGETDETAEAAAATRRRAAPRRFKTAPGGTLYRLRADGDVQKVKSFAAEIPFDLVTMDTGRLLVATGDTGWIYAVDGEGRSSVLLEIPSDQASALARGKRGQVLVGGTTDARVGRLGPGIREIGSYYSPTLDAGTVADWGRLGWDADVPSGARLRLYARSGNTDEPDRTWSDWVKVEPTDDSGAVSLPASRWFQARADLSTSRKGDGPALRRLELYYAPHNRRPTIEELTVQPAGVVWSRSPSQAARPVGPQVANDPVARQTVQELSAKTVAAPVRKTYELGARTVTWQATDPDGDSLTYRLEVRRDGAPTWVPLAERLEDPFYSWDARETPDGLYRIRLTVDDARSNPEGKQYSITRTSAAFSIDNTRPSVRRRRVQRADRGYEVEFVASDPGGNVAAVEVAVDTGEWQPLDPLDGVADSAEEHYQMLVETDADADPAERRTLRVRVTDAAGNLGGDAWPLEE